MTVENLIDHSLFPLKPSDSVAFAVETLLSLPISALPVVDDNKIIGFINGTSLVELSQKGTIKKIIKDNPEWIIDENLHYSEAVKLFFRT